jgi:hypothetical protein
MSPELPNCPWATGVMPLRFAEAYLATQKIVGAEEVWPADQVPIAVLRTAARTKKAAKASEMAGQEIDRKLK